MSLASPAASGAAPRAALLAVMLVAGTPLPGKAAGPPDSALARQEVYEGLYAEALDGDARATDAHLRMAQEKGTRDVAAWALCEHARALLARGELKGFDALASHLAGDRKLAAPIKGELAALRRLRDERPGERKGAAPAHGAPGAVADIRLVDTPLEDALAQIEQLYGTTIASEASDQKVSLLLRGVPIAHVLVAVAFQTGLAARRVGQTWYLGSAAHLDVLLPLEQGTGPQSAESLAAAERMKAPRPASPVTIDLDDVPLQDALARLSEATGANVVAPRSTRRVSLHLRGVGAPVAFDAVGSQLGQDVLRIFDMAFIAPQAVLASRFPAMEIRTVTLRRTSVGDVLDDVQGMADHDALGVTRIEMDVAANQIILEGPRESVDRIERFLKAVDAEPRRMELNITLTPSGAAPATHPPARRLRMLEQKTSMVTLVVPPQRPGGPEGQVSLELTPALAKNGRVDLSIHWRMTSVRAGVVQDVSEGPVTSVDATVGQTAVLTIPWPGQAPGEKLLLGLQPEL